MACGEGEREGGGGGGGGSAEMEGERRKSESSWGGFWTDLLDGGLQRMRGVAQTES